MYGAWVPSKSTTKTSREERFCVTLKRTAQYIDITQRMNVQRIRTATESAVLSQMRIEVLKYLFSPIIPRLAASTCSIFCRRY